MVKCDRCEADTVEKSLMSKKTGKPFQILECTNANCRSDRDPKYPYSFFPPKADKVGGYGNNRSSGQGKAYGKEPAKSVIEAGVMAQLESIQAKLDKMMAKLGA